MFFPTLNILEAQHDGIVHCQPRAYIFLFYFSAASEQGSSKSATIEMYAPSSYNETVTGETLSSISEKSATYSHPENHEEYIVS